MTFNVVPELDDWSCEASMNDRGLIERRHTEVYRVESTTFVKPFVAQGALPADTFAVLDVDPSARLRKLTTRFVAGKKDPWIYRSTFEYSTACPNQDQTDREHENPLDDQPEIEIDGEPILYPMFRDRDDTLIANSAMQPLASVQEERSIEVMTITRNEATRNSARDRAFRGTVNKYAWAGGAAGTVKITRIRATRAYRNGQKYYKYFYELKYNEKGWQPEVLNAGTKQYITTSGGGVKKVDCLDGDGQPVSEAVPLDDFGTQIVESALPDAAVYLKFKTLKETNFADLGLPQSD